MASRTGNYAVLLALAGWLLLFLGRFDLFSWLEPTAPWLPLALALGGGFLWMRAPGPRGLRYAVLAAIVLIGAAALASREAERDTEALEERWREHETHRIESILLAAAERVRELQDLSSRIGGEAQAFVLRRAGSNTADSLEARLAAFELLDNLAAETMDSGTLPPGTQIGIQLFDAQGNRIAWAGWPQMPGTQDRQIMAGAAEAIYTRPVSLYRILTHTIPVHDETGALQATVMVDMPLEVNYRVNNDFLKSTSLADNIAAGGGANVAFDYYPPPVRWVSGRGVRVRLDRPESAAGDTLAGTPVPEHVTVLGSVKGDHSLGLSGRIRVSSTLDNPLMGVTVSGRPLRYYTERHRAQYAIITSALLLAAIVILFVVSMKRFPARLAGGAGLIKAGYLVAFLVFIRYWLLSLTPALTSDVKLFEPALFATPILGGVMRSAGDLLITAIIFVVALYGLLKIARAETVTPPSRGGGWIFVLKGMAAAAVLMGVHELAARFVNNVVVNANPRLVGEMVQLLEPPVVVLHLSTFLMVAGIFLAGMIVTWGVYRLRGESGVTRASVLAAAVIVIAAAVLSRWDLIPILLLLLVFVALAPRVVQREDLVSIVIVAFAFVLIVSTSAYLFFNEDYQGLRRTFIQEKVAEMTQPSDNWKVFILEDVLENLSQDPSVRQALANPTYDYQRFAFDLWAGSSLSLLGYSSAIHVFDEADSLLSRFTVEMPYRVRLSEATERIETASDQDWVVLDLTTETPRGAVRFYRGIVNIGGRVPTPEGSMRTSLGKIVVDIPFYFESLAWAARTGPQTPELLRNVQEGGIVPRLEEPEALLLARLQEGRVLETSTDELPVGYTFDRTVLERAIDLEWPLLRTKGSTYRFFVDTGGEADTYLLAGFAVPSPLQHLLRWSTVLSLYFLFAFAIITIIIVLKSVPALRDLLPTLTPGRRLGFQQKLLASFLLIALFPAILLGAFSVRLIEQRVVQESRQEAINKAFSANKALANLVIGELHFVLAHADLPEIIGARAGRYFEHDPSRSLVVLDEEGSAISGQPPPDLSVAVQRRFPPEQVFVHEAGGERFVGAFSDPMSIVVDGDRRTFTLLYSRRLDEELLGEIADEVGADVNIYDGGALAASSREGLLSGGFASSMMNSDAFVRVSLMDVDESLVTEQAGRYRYEVAYVPVQSAGFHENAALAVPLLFRPESFHVEVQKATSIVLSIFALLSAATIGLGLLLARGIFEPLKGLLEGTRRISRGDLSFKLPSKRRDEIGTVVAAFNDMTDKLAASQKALEERRRYLEVILANIGTGVITTDANDHIGAANDAAARILGVEAAALTGKTGPELVDEGVAPEFFALFGRGVARQPFVSSEVELATEEGKRTIKYVRTQLTSEGRYAGNVFVFEDLTELINSKKLSAWVEMARQIAHEIKNPLTPIKLSTQFMVRAHEEKAPDFDAIFRESSEQIIHQVDVLRRIASEFSSFGRLQQLTVGTHDVAKQVRDIVAPYRRNDAGIEIDVTLPDGELRARFDPEALRRICTNLIENAMEAMTNGGRLKIVAGNASGNGAERVWISFTDTGPGLSEEAKEKLFEPYFSTKTTGTGLGLAICRSLSREMGGEVVIRNLENGSGVEATVFLQATS